MAVSTKNDFISTITPHFMQSIMPIAAGAAGVTYVANVTYEAVVKYGPQITEVFLDSIKPLSVLGTLCCVGMAGLTALSSHSEWIAYVSGSIFFAGVVWRMTVLDKNTSEARAESEKALLKATQEALYTELAMTRDQLKAYADLIAAVTGKLETTASLFTGLKDTYPDRNLFLEHLASIEKVTKVVHAHLEKNDVATATNLKELKAFLEKLNKQDMDQIALLLEMSKHIVEIENGVANANHSLEKLVGNQVVSG